MSCLDYLGKKFHDYEIIVVDDGSVDRTGDIASGLSEKYDVVKVVSHEINRGYGGALNSGFENSTKDFIFLMDSDDQFDINELDEFITHASRENVILGYRKTRADNVIRRLNTTLYNFYIRTLFGLNVKDIDCAFKLFPRAAYEEVKPLGSSGALLSAEMLIKMKGHGYDFRQLGVTHYPRPHGEQSGAKLSVILKMFLESWKLRKDLMS